MDNIRVQLLTKATEYTPGEYNLLFELELPGDIATTDNRAMIDQATGWSYKLVLTAQPSAVLARKKEIKQNLAVKRVHLTPSNTGARARYNVNREGEIEVVIIAPIFVNVGGNMEQDRKAVISLYLHPLQDRFRVEEIQVRAVQKEKILWDLSEVVVIKNPDLETDAAASWGRQFPIDVELDLELKGMLSTERLTWLEILHSFQAVVVFVDKTVQPIAVKVPFNGASVADVAWLHFLAKSTREQRELEQQRLQEQAQAQSRSNRRGRRTATAPVVLTAQDPPGYLDGVEHSVLLDANPSNWEDYIEPPMYDLESPVNNPPGRGDK
ncbi:hypothetical protein BGZ83_011034 [Gryganskiella cystojenkinii]|nr:hypothetical protein BGZ83_011034 [Gryganskiella cystojenkinii]